MARVSPQLVEEVRVELESDPDNPVARPQKRQVTRNGTKYEIQAPPADKEKQTELITEGLNAKEKSPFPSVSEAKLSTSPKAGLPIASPEKAADRIIKYADKLLKTLPEKERHLAVRLMEKAIRSMRARSISTNNAS